LPAERLDGIAAVLAAIRANGSTTQPQLTELVGLGRSVVAQRVAELESAGLVVQAGVAPSTGGRAPRQVRLRAEAGMVAGVDMRRTSVRMGIADLDGRVLAQRDESIDITGEPEPVFVAVERHLSELVREVGQATLWGVAMAVPAPVEFDAGRPVHPPFMPRWDGYPIGKRVSQQLRAPTWVDNDVNVRALAELRMNPAAAAVRDMLYVHMGDGIGAGLVSDGRVHRGATGCAGDFADIPVAEAGNVICRCGKVGCLIAVTGAAALGREAQRLAESGASPVLAEVLEQSGILSVADVIEAARRGDAAARTMLARAGSLLGGTLATLIGFYNPALVVLGGDTAASDDVVAAIHHAVEERAPSLATRALQIARSTIGDDAGVLGAIHLVLEELFSPDYLVRWLPYSSPSGHPEIVGIRPPFRPGKGLPR
jgi:predicted NBD/HSP70 family sugar kinase